MKRSNLTAPRNGDPKKLAHWTRASRIRKMWARIKICSVGSAYLLFAATPPELGALSLFELALSCGQFGLHWRERAGMGCRALAGDSGKLQEPAFSTGFEADDRPALRLG